MTCIIGLEHKGKVYIGGDSAGTDRGLSLQIRKDAKVFRNGPFLIGFTDSFRMGQLLRYCLKPPRKPSGLTDMHYLVSHFIPAVRDCFRQGGYLKRDSDVEWGGSFLLGFKKRLYEVNDDFQVGQVHTGIAAVGCGSSLALGAMHALNLEPVSRIETTLQIVEQLNAGVRGPFTVLSL